jgi:hypothetical protein
MTMFKNESKCKNLLCNLLLGKSLRIVARISVRFMFVMRLSNSKELKSVFELLANKLSV